MVGTYLSAVLIGPPSMEVGRALLSISGREAWSWLEPAVGFGAIVAVTGLCARLPGPGTTATLGALARGGGAIWVVAKGRDRATGALAERLPGAVAVAGGLGVPLL